MTNVELMVSFTIVSVSLSIKTRPLLTLWNHAISGILQPLATHVNVAFSPKVTATSSGAIMITALAVN